MEDSEALLRFIHKNAAMGVGTLPQALSLPQSRAMTSALQDQLREYRSIAARSQSYAKEKGLHLKGPGSAALAMSGMMLRAQTALDPSTSKLAEMMIQGSTMGTVEMTSVCISSRISLTRSWSRWAGSCYRQRNKTFNR